MVNKMNVSDNEEEEAGYQQDKEEGNPRLAY